VRRSGATWRGQICRATSTALKIKSSVRATIEIVSRPLERSASDSGHSRKWVLFASSCAII